MKYIKNMNVNFVNNDYLKEHFAEDEVVNMQANLIQAQSIPQQNMIEIPEELRGVDPDKIEQNI